MKSISCQKPYHAKYTGSHDITEVKGQLISKGLFRFFNSYKKRTKNFGPSVLGQKIKFSSWLLGKLKRLKFLFEIN